MPGNTTDVKTLIPIANRLKQQFAIGKICVVCDRGMISKNTITELENMGWEYILVVRMHRVKEFCDTVVNDPGPYEEIYPERLLAQWRSTS